MFSKAKVKRFNEEVGCAPPPTAYNPKSLDKSNSFSIDKAERFKELREITPAPNAYSIPVLTVVTPKKIARSKLHNKDATSLDSSVVSNVSSSSIPSAKGSRKEPQFVSPLAPHLSRSGSCKSFRSSSMQHSMQVRTLQHERDDLQEKLMLLENRLSKLHLKSLETLDASSQTDEPGIGPNANSGQLDLELLQEEIAHLTMLRDNLEESVAHKDRIIVKLQQEHCALEQHAALHKCFIEACEDALQRLELKVHRSLNDNYQEQVNVAFPEELDTNLTASESCCITSLSTLPVVNWKQQHKEVLTRVAEVVASYRTLSLKHADHTRNSLKTADSPDTIAELSEKVYSYEGEFKRNRNDASQQIETNESENKDRNNVINEELSMNSLAVPVACQSEEECVTALLLECQNREKDENCLEQLKMAVRETDVLQQFLEKEVSSEKKVAMVLKEELESVRSENKQLRSDIETSGNEVLALKVALSAKEYDVDATEEKISELRKEILIKERFKDELQDQLLEYKNTNTALENVIKEKELDVSRLESELQRAQSETNQLHKLLEETRLQQDGEIKCLQEQHNCEVSNLRKENEAEVFRLLHAQHEHSIELSCLKDEHEAAMAGVREEKEASLRRLTVLERERDDAELLVEHLEEKLAENKQCITDLEARIVELTASIEDSEEQHRRVLENLRSELDQISTQYSDSLIEADATKRALTHGLEDTQLELHAKEADVLQLTEELTAKNDECMTLESSLKNLTEKYEALESAKEQAATEQGQVCDGLRAELLLAQQDSAVLRAEVSSLQSTSEGFAAQIIQLKTDLSKKADALEECKNCLEQQRQDKILAENKALALHQQVQKLELHLQEREKHLTQYQLQLKESDKALQEACVSAQSRMKEVEELNARVTYLEVEETTCKSVLQSHYDKFHEVMAEYAERLEVKEDELVIMRQEVLKLQEELDLVAELKNDVALKTRNLEERIQTLTNENIDNKKVIELQLKQIENLDNKCMIEEAKFRLAVDEMNTKMCRAQDENQANIEKVFKLQEELNDKTGKSEANEQEHQDTIASLQKNICSLTEKLVINEKKLSEAQAAHTSYVHENEKSCERVSRLMTEHQKSYEQLKLKNEEVVAEAALLRQRCQILEKLVEPFREQLESYEAERSLLLSSQSAAQREASELSQKYASLLGHHNHKQKIQHVVKLKADNSKLNEEVLKLRVEMDRYRKIVRRLEDKLEVRATLKRTVAARPENHAENKENESRSPLKASNVLNRLQ